jgi:hypothetical protein
MPSNAQERAALVAKLRDIVDYFEGRYRASGWRDVNAKANASVVREALAALTASEGALRCDICDHEAPRHTVSDCPGVHVSKEARDAIQRFCERTGPETERQMQLLIEASEGAQATGEAQTTCATCRFQVARDRNCQILLMAAGVELRRQEAAGHLAVPRPGDPRFGCALHEPAPAAVREPACIGRHAGILETDGYCGHCRPPVGAQANPTATEPAPALDLDAWLRKRVAWHQRIVAENPYTTGNDGLRDKHEQLAEALAEELAALTRVKGQR